MLGPLALNRWDFDAAAHLLVRAGFGGRAEEIEKLHALGPAKAISSLVDSQPESYAPPACADPMAKTSSATSFATPLRRNRNSPYSNFSMNGSGTR
jgi:hypothetical protein